MPNNVQNLDKILESVSKFYGDAWISLVTVLATIIAASVTIVGVIIPLLIAYLQRRQQSNEFKLMLQQKDEEIHIKLENLKQIVIEENTKILESLEEKVQKKYEEKEKELLNKIQNVQYYSRASVAHIQGLIFGFNEYEIEAATYYVNAAEYYFLNSDDYNLSIVCGNLINREKNLISLDLQNNKGKKFISDLKTLLNKLKKDQNSGTARKLVHDIETAFYSLL